MGEAAPLYGTAADPVPEGAAAEWFVGAGGARLRAALFPAKGTARGSVILSGGRTEPIEKYFETAGELTSRGFVVLCHDWRGQGLSQRLLPDRLKGHAAGADDYVADYAALIAAVETRLPKPWIAVGHSMGGCLTALVLARGETRMAGAVLSAPMLGLHTTPLPAPVARLGASTLTAIGLGARGTPGGGPVATFETNTLTHDPARYARNVGMVDAHPDLALGPPTWSWLAFAFGAIGELQSRRRASRGRSCRSRSSPPALTASSTTPGPGWSPAASRTAAMSKRGARSTRCCRKPTDTKALRADCSGASSRSRAFLCFPWSRRWLQSSWTAACWVTRRPTSLRRRPQRHQRFVQQRAIPGHRHLAAVAADRGAAPVGDHAASALDHRDRRLDVPALQR